MDLRAEILREHSKPQALRIANWIGTDQQRFDQLIELFLNDHHRVAQRAAWILGFSAEAHPQLILPHLKSLLKNLQKPGIHDAVKRNALRIVALLELPDALMGLAADICFDFLANPKEPVAIRVHAMQVLYNISLKEPDLADELCLLIEDGMHHGSAGFRSRGRKILKALGRTAG